MPTQNVWKGVAVLIVLAVVLAGCGTGSSTGAAPTGAPTGAATGTPGVPPTFPPAPPATVAAASTAPAASGTTPPEPATPAGTAVPATSAASPAALSGPLLALQTANNDVLLADAAGNTRVLARGAPHFNEAGISAVAGAAHGTLYALSAPQPGATYQLYAVDAQGARRLNLAQTDGYGLAVWPGKDAASTLLAWGLSDLTSAPYRSQLFTGAPGAAQGSAVLDETRPEPRLLVPLRWSRDGKRLYFSKEPTGFGGYILFGGTSSLWVYDAGSLKANMLVDEGQAGGMICMDDLSPDEHLVAHTCSNKVLTLLDLTTGKSTAIQPPAGLPEFDQLGSAQFSPDGKRVAYAIAAGNPDKEQGWAVLTDGLQGASRLIATSEPAAYYNVKGWLDANTVILQSYGKVAGIWLVKTDGSPAAKVAEGNFLAVVPP